MPVLEFSFDFVSPMSYFALVQLDGLQARTGCEIAYVPVFLGGIMQASGNTPPGAVAAKAAYMNRDMQRLAQKHGVPFAFTPAFPMNTLPLLRMVDGLTDTEERLLFIRSVFRHIWAEPKDMSQKAIRDAALTADGFDTDRLNEFAGNDIHKQGIKRNTEAALARGAFGAPTFFVGNEMFFGQDRLDMVEATLTGTIWAQGT